MRLQGKYHPTSLRPTALPVLVLVLTVSSPVRVVVVKGTVCCCCTREKVYVNHAKEVLS